MAIKTGGGFLNEINVTPFVDVMLVLLIIFMVTAPLMTQGVEVDLPTTRTVKNLPQDSEHLVLSVKKDGTLFLDEYQVGLDELEEHLKRLVSKQKKQPFPACGQGGALRHGGSGHGRDQGRGHRQARHCCRNSQSLKKTSNF